MAAVDGLLARKADLAATEADGSTALHWAAQRNDAKLVDQLLAAGAKVDAATRYNITPLYFACLNGNLAMVESLLKAGADPNGTAEQGQTALMTASLSGNAGVVKLLLSRGAKVDTAEPYRGQTALMWAASKEHGRRRDAGRVRRIVKGEVEGRVHAASVRGSQWPHRNRQGLARA